MLSLYGRKIKTRDEIREIIGPRPRDKRVIMCHGTFDIIHPGHLRHLSYAKEKADLLIASVTCDDFVSKGPHRPYVPEELRAVNLAALEVVDYVLIDRNNTPIENILEIQPDLFAKGYEYISDGVRPKTQEETDALETYGGEILFTPGDVVYSSSALLQMQTPNLAHEKLAVLMDSEGITFDSLRSTVRSLASVRVHVIGDTIVDKYTTCALLGAAPKSPTFSVREGSSELFVGGAAIVAEHARALGADVRLSTVLGQDELKDFVLQRMSEQGIEVLAQVDPTRPTTLKERFIVEGQRMLQVDRVDNRVVSERHQRGLQSDIRDSTADVYIFSDFRHGIFHHSTIEPLVSSIPGDALKAGDSQVSNRWGNILDFRGFDLITPNEREARFALADQDSVVRPLASRLYREASCRWLILKLGERGMLCHRSAGEQPRDFFMIDSFVENLVDPLGAGDSVLATTSLVLARSSNFVAGAILGSMAAAIACEREGNIPVGLADVEDKLDKVAKVTEMGHPL